MLHVVHIEYITYMCKSLLTLLILDEHHEQT